jgi:large repetitive protein
VTITVASGLGKAPAEAPLVINALPATTSNRRPVLTGRAPSGATIRVYDGDQLLGEAKAGPDGLWYFVPTAPLATGEHVLRFEVVGPDGGAVTSVDRRITVAAGATAVEPPKITVPAQGQAAPGDLLTGTAPPGSQVQIYEGGTLIGGTTAGANGKWRFRLPKNLGAGKHEIHVVAVDQSGSPVSQSVTLTIEVSPPRTLPVTGGVLMRN